MADTKGGEVNRFQAATFRKYAEQEMANEFEPRLGQFLDAAKSEGIEVVGSKTRAKDPGSLQEKMNGKWADRTLDQATDGIGGRIIVKDQKDADKLVAKMPRLMGGMKVLEHQDTVDSGKGGYRAHNLLVRTPGGFVAELQVKTHNQDLWSRFSHSAIYKNPDMNKDPEVAGYMKRVSDHLNEVDHGRDPGSSLPDAPTKVKAAGLEFPWKHARLSPKDEAKPYELPKVPKG
jgi:ppGpp synthetase/RelA/SpoT-type nucleotidyltranferase